MASEVAQIDLDGEKWDIRDDSVSEQIEYEKPIFLWENSAPTKTFGSQTISFSSSVPERFNMFEVEYKTTTTADYINSVRFSIGNNSCLSAVYAYSASAPIVVISRFINSSSRNGITFDTGRQYVYNQYSVLNTVIIPLRIWAYYMPKE